MAKPGRKPGQSKWTQQLQDALEGAIRMGLTNKDACLVAGISQETFYEWQHGMTRGVPPDFSERIARARAERTQLMLGHLRRAGMGLPAILAQYDDQGKLLVPGRPAVPPDWRAASDFLDRTAPDYRKPTKMELTGRDGAPIAIAHSGAMPGDEFNFDSLSMREQFDLDQMLAKVTTTDAPLALPSGEHSEDSE